MMISLEALNSIDLEFSPRLFSRTKERAVIDAWRALFGEYGQVPPDGAPAHEVLAWNNRVNERLVDLLFAMSRTLGYDFSEEQLRRGIYYPRGRFDLEQTQLAILRGLRSIVDGNASIPMKVTEFPSSPELLEAQISMMQKSAGAYGPDGALRVRMVMGNSAKPSKP